MIQRGGRARLAAKAFEGLRVVDDVNRKKL
jgi:hypothetical protein